MSSTPSEIHCLACHSKQHVKDLHIEDTSFVSKKNKVTMVRRSWKGTCEKCGNTVRQFTKAEKKEEKEVSSLAGVPIGK